MLFQTAIYDAFFQIHELQAKVIADPVADFSAIISDIEESQTV